MSDVLIVGGGIIGLTLARELALHGARVTLLERQDFGREASWAGAGILPPTAPGTPDDLLTRLTSATHLLWPQLTAELRESTGLDNGFRRCGGITLAVTASTVPEWTFRDPPRSTLADEMAGWRTAGAVVEPLDPAGLQSAEPLLAPQPEGGFRLPDLCQVRNPWHLQALLADVRRLGVDLRPGTPVREVWQEGDLARGVITETDRLAADRVVIASGAWSGVLLPRSAERLPTLIPVRGQMVLFRMLAPPLRHVIECGNRYLVPRDDGRVLAGATEEQVGFDRRTTPEATAGLVAFAQELLPALRGAVRERTWAGLRPYSSRSLPSIGPVPGCEGLYLAAGHYRAGLHLSPITARVLRQMLAGEQPDFPVTI